MVTGSPLLYTTRGILFKSKHSSSILEFSRQRYHGGPGGETHQQRERSEQRQETGDLVVSGQEKKYKVVCQSTQEVPTTHLQKKTNLHLIPILDSGPGTGKGWNSI